MRAHTVCAGVALAILGVMLTAQTSWATIYDQGEMERRLKLVAVAGIKLGMTAQEAGRAAEAAGVTDLVRDDECQDCPYQHDPAFTVAYRNDQIIVLLFRDDLPDSLAEVRGQVFFVMRGEGTYSAHSPALVKHYETLVATGKQLLGFRRGKDKSSTRSRLSDPNWTRYRYSSRWNSDPHLSVFGISYQISLSDKPGVYTVLSEELGDDDQYWAVRDVMTQSPAVAGQVARPLPLTAQILRERGDLLAGDLRAFGQTRTGPRKWQPRSSSDRQVPPAPSAPVARTIPSPQPAARPAASQTTPCSANDILSGRAGC